MTEIWFRDPISYIKECAKLLVPNICWEGRLIDQKAIDPQAQLEMHYPHSFNYRMLIVRYDGTVELQRGYTPDLPYAVYPTWSYDDDSLDELEEMLANPAGMDMTVCSDPLVAPSNRPVFGQEHRVVVTRWPDARTNVGRSFLRALMRFQSDYPDAIIHLWGSNSFRACFGMQLASADFDAAVEAKYQTIFIPNGRRVKWNHVQQFAQWVRLIGFSQAELSKAEKRIEFNMKSAQWAAEHFEDDIRFKSTGYTLVDPNSPDHWPATTIGVMSRKLKVGDSDKITCDTCSLFSTCKYYREEAVCSLPDTEGAKLAAFFHTRSSDVIIEGLGKVIATQAERFEIGVEDEKWSEDGLNPNVTRLGHVIVDDGVKLAKLVDPLLAAAGATRVTAFIGGQHIHNNQTPNSLMANIVAELEAQGIARANITEEMVNEFIMREHDKSKAIEAQVQP